MILSIDVGGATDTPAFDAVANACITLSDETEKVLMGLKVSIRANALRGRYRPFARNKAALECRFRGDLRALLKGAMQCL